MKLSGLGGDTQIRGYGCKPNVAQGPMLLVLGLEVLVQFQGAVVGGIVGDIGDALGGGYMGTFTVDRIYGRLIQIKGYET